MSNGKYIVDLMGRNKALEKRKRGRKAKKLIQNKTKQNLFLSSWKQVSQS